MRAAILLVLFALPVFAQQPAPAQRKDSCVECHALLDGNLRRPAQLFEDDIHRKNGFSCAACHGGDPASDEMETAMSPKKGFQGKITRQKTPGMCARCHSDAKLIHQFKPQQRVDQIAQYRTSVHGKRLAAGDLNVATCVDCHSVHDIREVKDALAPVHPVKLPETCARCHGDPQHMKQYSIPTNQFEQYRRSVHWEALAQRGDLSAPSCATCHGNHAAAPPGVADVSHVCGTCHVVFQNLFDSSPHKAAFDGMGLAACVVCHQNHEVSHPKPEMLGTAKEAVCSNCHGEGDRGYAAAAVMKKRLDELRRALSESEEMLNRAETSGMEISEGRLQWTSAHEQWIKARLQVHAFRPEALEEPVKEGLTLAVKSRETGINALREREYRRKGLAISLLTIAVTMAGLWLAVRALESRKNR